MREDERARRVHVFRHAEDVDDRNLPVRVVRLEARIDDPVVVDREVLQPREILAVGILAVANAHAGFARALDQIERERATLQQGGIAGQIRRQLDVCDRLAVVRDAGAVACHEVDLVPIHHERARALGERRVVEHQRIGFRASERVRARLEPEEPGQSEPPGLAREGRETPRLPLFDALTLPRELIAADSRRRDRHRAQRCGRTHDAD